MMQVSIHASVRRRQQISDRGERVTVVSIHASVRRRPNPHRQPPVPLSCFNPRLREEATVTWHAFRAGGQCFNPRLREEATVIEQLAELTTQIQLEVRTSCHKQAIYEAQHVEAKAS